MRFNKKHSVIHYLDNGEINDFFLIPKRTWLKERKDYFREEIKNTFQHYCPKFRSNVRYITEPFYSAFEKAQKKLSEVCKSNKTEGSGTLIYKTHKGDVKTIFYHIALDPNEEGVFEYCFMEFLLYKQLSDPVLTAASMFNAGGLSGLKLPEQVKKDGQKQFKQ